MKTKETKITTHDIAAYLLDRADQYVTSSPCWIALSDAARNVALGEVTQAKDSGELDAELYGRIKSMARGAEPVPVEPELGVDDDLDDEGTDQ